MLKVYFLHLTLTPQNVRMTWDDAVCPPAVGDEINHDGRGEPGTTWQATRVLWLNSRAVEVTVATVDAPKSAN